MARLPAAPPAPASASAAGDDGRPAIVLLAHGARDPAWALPFEAVAAEVARQAPGTVVRLAFLEFMAPSLPEAGRALARQGCPRVQVVPLFLGAGGHVRKDVPAQLDALAREHPGVHWRLHPAIGEHEAVIRAMAAGVLSLAAGPPGEGPPPGAAGGAA